MRHARRFYVAECVARHPRATRRILTTLVLSLQVVHAHAAISLSGIFSDHMVLQRDQEIPVWGSAVPGEAVVVSLADTSATATADAQGRWASRLKAQGAGGPYTLTVSGATETLVFNDVLIGEVWFCSGQSNMQWSVKQSDNAASELAAAGRPEIRLFNVPLIVAAEPQTSCGGAWRVCTPETVASFSAAAYFFGRDLQNELDVPVGLIDCSSGGRPIETYMSVANLASHSYSEPILRAWQDVCARGPEYKAAYDKDMAEWKTAVEAARAAGTPLPQEPYPPLGPGHWNEPGGLFNGSVHPVAPYGIRGALWYQGESNTDRADQYKRLQPDMIREWRALWGQGDFPFIFVQLPNYGVRQSEPQPDSRWAEFREAQRQTLSEPNCGMIVCIDIGDPDDIHPTNKQDVGARLARMALATVYNHAIVATGPMLRDAKRVGNRFVLRFDHVGAGLSARPDGAGGKNLEGFMVAGSDQRFQWADAAVTAADTVEVWSDEIPEPAAVRYAWADDPVISLHNDAGLPAAPFRTDTWPLESEGRLTTTFEYLGASRPAP